MTKLIINADDFGLCKGVNYGIIEAYKFGMLKSTTLMITMDEAEHAIALAKEYPDLKIGLHLNACLGNPLTSTMCVNEEGKMMKITSGNEQLFTEEVVYTEFKAQYEKFIELVGKKPTHFDSHLLSTDRLDSTRAAVVRLSNETKLPIRNVKGNGVDVDFVWYSTLGFDVDTYEGLDYLYDHIEEIKKYDVVELMVHPAYVDTYIMNNSSWNMMRLKDLDSLVDPKLKVFLEEHGMMFTDFEEVNQ